MTKRYRGTCVACGKKYVVKKNGTIGEHSGSLIDPKSSRWCEGMDLPPLETSRDGLLEVQQKVERHIDSLASDIRTPPHWWKEEYKARNLAETRSELAAYQAALVELKPRVKKWKPTQLTEAEPAKKRKDYGSGTCCVCNRAYKLKKDGTIRGHNCHPETIVGYRYCMGQDLRPLETTNEDCLQAIASLDRKCNSLRNSLANPDLTEHKDDIERRAEKTRIELRVYERYRENCQRNHDMWSVTSPVPNDVLPAISDAPKLDNSRQAKMTSQNTVTVEIKNSGCLGVVLLLAAIPLLSLVLIK